MTIIPQRRYSLIYCDPPWSYRDKSMHRGGAERHYRTMSLGELEMLDVGALARDDCALALWITAPMLSTGDHLRLMRAWRFEPKTVLLTWIKTNRDGSLATGMGRWSRSNAEFCLLGTRGKPKRVSKSVHSVIISPREAHSAKPAEARNRLVELFGDVSRIELFARERVDGWDAWGNECPPA